MSSKATKDAATVLRLLERGAVTEAAPSSFI
jgi:hypothetical protein